MIALGVLCGVYLSDAVVGRQNVHQPPEISFTTSAKDSGISLKIDQQTIPLNETRELTLKTNKRPSKIELSLEPGMTAVVGTKTTYTYEKVDWYTFVFGLTCIVWALALIRYVTGDDIAQGTPTEGTPSISQRKKIQNNNIVEKPNAGSNFPDVQLSIDLSRQVYV